MRARSAGSCWRASVIREFVAANNAKGSRTNWLLIRGNSSCTVSWIALTSSRKPRGTRAVLGGVWAATSGVTVAPDCSAKDRAKARLTPFPAKTWRRVKPRTPETATSASRARPRSTWRSPQSVAPTRRTTYRPCAWRTARSCPIQTRPA